MDIATLGGVHDLTPSVHARCPGDLIGELVAGDV
jgi:hypothetical protein